MKLAVLTTETVHHAYFVDRVQRVHPIDAVLVERRPPAPPFETHHPFEDARERYEREAWFDGRDVTIDAFAEAASFDSLNEPGAVASLARIAPDVVVVFGTGKLAGPVIDVCPHGMVNLHGGDPQRHRGLDTHLWAIHEDRFDALVTTLHAVNARLDDGPIVGQDAVPVHAGMHLHELRRFNTERCVDLTVRALDDWTGRGRFATRPQARRGRYYSFMPTDLKEDCRRRFEAYTETLS